MALRQPDEPDDRDDRDDMDDAADPADMSGPDGVASWSMRDSRRWQRDDDDSGELPRHPEPDAVPPRLQPGPSLFRHIRDISGIIVLITLLIAWTVPVRLVPVWLSTLVYAAMTAITWHQALKVTRSRAVAGYLLCWGLLLTVWLTLARLAGPWHHPVETVAGLVVPSLVLAGAGISVIGHHREAVDRDKEAAERSKGTVIAGRWERLLAEHEIPGAQILDVRENRDGGFEIRGRLGRAGRSRRAVTYSQLTAKAAELAVSLRRDEDGVLFSRVPNGSAADFVLHVRARRTGPRKPVHLPVSNRPGTINRPFGIGVLDSGREYEVLLREIHMQLIGVTRAGKSNLINVLLDRLAGMVDVLIWMIDMKGGVTARPWVTPWLQEFAPRPVIDWVATTREETELMLKTALTAVNARAAYTGFEKIVPSMEIPAIVLICDDVSVCFGHGTRDGGISNWNMSQLGSQFTELAGGAAGVLIGAGQRANVELWGGTGMKAQSELRVGLRCTEPGDGAQIFPDDPQAARMVSKLRDKGDCLVKNGPDVSPVVHLYRVGDEERILKRAMWAGDYRPQAEKRMADAMGEAYADRWTRLASLLDEWRATAGIQPPPETNYDDEFGSIIAHLEDPEAPVHPARARMRDIVRLAGWEGISVQRITTRLDGEGLTVARETVHRWLREDETAGLVHRPPRGSKNWRWARHDGDHQPPL